jgi:pimeloyl-ACP methyl ester carboxylesterase
MAACIFLPGILMPAVLRYEPLIAELGPGVDARTKELEIYTLTPPGRGYSIDAEVAGLLAVAEREGLERFHLCGHSAGGAVALAFTAAHPELVATLALDEAAFDFSEEMAADLAGHADLRALMSTDPAAAMSRFMALELRAGVEPPATPPPGPALPNRPAGVAALLGAFERHRIDYGALARFEGRVLYTRGSLSAERYERSARRLGAAFGDFREVVFDGVHHLRTSHLAEPARVARLLTALWAGD